MFPGYKSLRGKNVLVLHALQSEKWEQVLKGQSNEIFDPQCFAIQSLFGTWVSSYNDLELGFYFTEKFAIIANSALCSMREVDSLLCRIRQENF
jgi:hypothetical protein